MDLIKSISHRCENTDKVRFCFLLCQRPGSILFCCWFVCNISMQISCKTSFISMEIEAVLSDLFYDRVSWNKAKLLVNAKQPPPVSHSSEGVPYHFNDQFARTSRIYNACYWILNLQNSSKFYFDALFNNILKAL